MPLLHATCSRDGWWLCTAPNCCTTVHQRLSTCLCGNCVVIIHWSLSSTRLSTTHQSCATSLLNNAPRKLSTHHNNQDTVHSPHLRSFNQSRMCSDTRTRARAKRDVAMFHTHTASVALRLPNLQPCPVRASDRQGIHANRKACCITQVLALHCQASQPRLQPQTATAITLPGVCCVS